jgi:hypothetical protein
MSKEAMKLALEIAIDYMNERLEDHDCKYQRHPTTEAERINILADIETVKEALAKQEQGEPVAWLYHDAGSLEEMLEAERKCFNLHSVLLSIRRHEAYRNETPLYTTPQQRTWVGLDPEEIRKTNHHMVDGAYHYSFKQGAEWAEAKLKEKNT